MAYNHLLSIKNISNHKGGFGLCRELCSRARYHFISMNVTVDQCLTGRHQKTQVTSYQVPTEAKILRLNCTEVAKSRAENRPGCMRLLSLCRQSSTIPDLITACIYCLVLLDVRVSRGWQGCVPYRESGRIWPCRCH